MAFLAWSLSCIAIRSGGGEVLRNFCLLMPTRAHVRLFKHADLQCHRPLPVFGKPRPGGKTCSAEVAHESPCKRQHGPSVVALATFAYDTPHPPKEKRAPSRTCLHRAMMTAPTGWEVINNAGTLFFHTGIELNSKSTRVAATLASINSNR